MVCHGTRPANHPVRRLAVLVKLLRDSSLEHLSATLMAIWERGRALCETLRGARSIIAQYLEVLPHYTDPYWEHHYTFRAATGDKGIALIGPGLRQQILVNVFLPHLYFTLYSLGNQDDIAAFARLLEAVPPENTRTVRHLEERFFGRNKGRIVRSALHEQGLYFFSKSLCSNFSSSCFGCPFPQQVLS